MRTDIGVWSVRSAIEGARLRHPDDVEMLAFSPDGRYLAIAADDNIIRLWNGDGWHQVASTQRLNPRRLVFSEDSRHLLVHSQKGGLEIMSVDKTLDAVQLIAPPLRGNALLTSRYALFEQGGKFDVWRTADGKVVAQGLGRALPLDNYALNDRQNLLAIVIGQRPEGKQRYAPLDYRIEVRDLPDGRRVVELPLGDLRPVHVFFLPGGQRLVVVRATGSFRAASMYSTRRNRAKESA